MLQNICTDTRKSFLELNHDFYPNMRTFWKSDIWATPHCF